MIKVEVEQYLDEVVAAASILRDKALDDNSDIQVPYFFCRGVDDDPAIQLYNSIRYIATMLEVGVMQKEHGDNKHEIGIMYKGWYLYELEDNENE